MRQRALRRARSDSGKPDRPCGPRTGIEAGPQSASSTSICNPPAPDAHPPPPPPLPSRIDGWPGLGWPVVRGDRRPPAPPPPKDRPPDTGGASGCARGEGGAVCDASTCLAARAAGSRAARSPLRGRGIPSTPSLPPPQESPHRGGGCPGPGRLAGPDAQSTRMPAPRAVAAEPSRPRRCGPENAPSPLAQCKLLRTTRNPPALRPAAAFDGRAGR